MTFITKNVNYGAPLKISGWRKIAIGTWRSAGDPSVYGILELDAEPVLSWIEKARHSQSERVTLTHVVGKVVGDAIRLHPSINCVLRWGKLYPRQDVDIFFQVAADTKGTDLSGVTLRRVDTMSVTDIAKALNSSASAIRENRDQSYTKMKNLASIIPGFFAHWLVGFGGIVTGALNLWTPLLGIPRDSFGSIMITNVGSLGLEEAFAPLVPYSRVPILVAVGAVKERPVVKDGQIVIGKRIKLCVTFDHRLIDGVHAGKMAETIKGLFENPRF